MCSDAKKMAYSVWYELLSSSENSMDAEDRYDDLLSLADDYCCRGIINPAERNTLIEIATAAYTRSVA
jgi:hypothetical protein